MPLQVAFLWHMHQPSYVDTAQGTALMPWVRLHATKGYLDMIWLVEQVPQFRCTFNLTPVLVQQIQQLAEGRVRDLWHELARTPAAELTPEQKCSLLDHFFKAQWDNMIRPYPRYWALLQKRGTRGNATTWSRLVGSFDTQEYLDLQAWFNLTWFGYAAQRLYPEIAELKSKGRGFTEEDKQTIFHAQNDILRNVLGYYRAVAERGQIEISTTPFYHPIMPLVYNTEFARRCMPGVQLPRDFSHPEDVREHLRLARELHTKTFGAPPRGLWPSEGSVCPELIPIFQELGFEWFATDEDILWRSLATTGPGSSFDRKALFRGYQVRFNDSTVGAAFRDRTVSDFIGFSAARNTPQRAADFIVQHLESVAREQQSGDDGLCAIVLDGENAWEHFVDGGEAFLRLLYERLGGHADLQTTTLHEYFTQHPPSDTIRTLHTGSWIQANFGIWIGQSEDNRAWDALGQTRQFLQSKHDQGQLTAEKYRQAMQDIYAAEGSDWFWWYGDDFVTENDLIFDELFRSHLQNVYRLCGEAPPDFLKLRICRSEITLEARQPSDLIAPVFDGQISSYYEWASAGLYEAGHGVGAMYRTEHLVQSVHFGFDMANLYLRVDFRKGSELPKQSSIAVRFIQPKEFSFIVTNLQSGNPSGTLFSPEGGLIEPISHQVGFGTILELGLPFQSLRCRANEPISFYVQVLADGVELERHPDVGTISVMVPDEFYDVRNWRV